MRSHRYRPGTSICFVTEGAKPREVFAADFRDRIVHHLLLARTEPLFERRFIHDSYACRKGKGVLGASDRLTTFLRQATAGSRRPAWALKLDVASFFPSIHKRTLYDILCRSIRDPKIRWLTATILFHDPTSDFVFHPGPHFIAHPSSPHYPVETRKSIFGLRGERGLPIGNLTSQFWANVYLSELDHFVKRELGCRWYVRYVDDLVGWKTWATHRVPRRRTLAALDHKLREAGRALVHREAARAADTIDLTMRTTTPPGSARLDELAVANLRSTVASYSGHLRWGSSWRAWHRIQARHPWLVAVYACEGWGVRLRWDGGVAREGQFWRQYWRLATAAAPRMLVFCQVGAFVEFRGPFVDTAVQVLGLRPVSLPRGPFPPGRADLAARGAPERRASSVRGVVASQFLGIISSHAGQPGFSSRN